MITNPYVRSNNDGSTEVTEAGYTALANMVTDPTGQVYSFLPGANPVMVAAAMARLSRSPDDLRVIMLKEFADLPGDKASDLLRRVVTQYGDDSVQQLVGVHVVVEGASNWLTKQLEWGRLGSYLEQSTRYIYFDRKGLDGKYNYYTPSGLTPSLEESYHRSMAGMFERYSRLVRELTEYVRNKNLQGDADRNGWLASTRAQACDAVRALLPVATRSTVGIHGSAQAIDNLIMHLMSLDMPEARAAGLAIYEQAKQVIPVFLERTMMPDRGLGTVAYRSGTRASVRELGHKYLEPDTGMGNLAPVRLLDYFPHDERELAAEMLFASSDLRIEEIRRQLQYWRQERKEEVLRAYMGERLNRRHKPGRALEKAHYEWEVLGDYGTFRDLQRHRMVDAFEWQNLTPGYGFEVPRLIKEAGLEDSFRGGFAQSELLYYRMVEAGFGQEAQYATVMGHRMRYRLVTNARALFHILELRTSPQGHPGYRLICQQMYDLLGKVHPIVASGMRFVNQNDMDGTLTRLAAEKATAYKLQLLVGETP